MNDLRVVCFDWGGVIVRICREWSEACSRVGLPVHDVAVAPAMIEQRRALSHAYQLGQMNCEEFFDRISMTADRMYSPDDVRCLHDAWLIEEYPGVSEVIDALHAHDTLTTALLSNTNARHWARMHDGPDGFGTAGKLHVRLASHELGVAKPDKEIFCLAADRFGVRPGQILFFDDLAENVQAARSAGWNAEQIDHAGDTASQMRMHLASHGITI